MIDTNEDQIMDDSRENTIEFANHADNADADSKKNYILVDELSTQVDLFFHIKYYIHLREIILFYIVKFLSQLYLLIPQL